MKFTLTLCRLYAGPYHQEEIKISESKSFTLINMPYCLTGMLSAYIESYMAIKPNFVLIAFGIASL